MSSIAIGSPRTGESVNLEDISMIYETIRLLKLVGLFHNPPVWRRFVNAPVIAISLFGQYYYILTMDLTIYALVFNGYLIAPWTNAFARASIMIYKHQKYLQIIEDIKNIYQVIKASGQIEFITLIYFLTFLQITLFKKP